METTKTETRKMKNEQCKRFAQQEDLGGCETSPKPSLRTVKCKLKYLATVSCLKTFIEG